MIFFFFLGYLTRWNWNTFDSDFGGVISNMKRHSDLIAPAMQPTTMKEKKLEEGKIHSRTFSLLFMTDD